MAYTDDARKKLLAGWIAEYGDIIQRTCFLYLGDRELAEDALQDTFLKAWRHMAQFEGRDGCNEKTWLMRIAINTCHDYHRSRWFRHIDMRQALEELPGCQIPSFEEDETLLLDIARLPEQQKQVVLLRYYHNMSVEEVAQKLGIGAAAVRYRLGKALNALKIAWTEADVHEDE